MWSSNTSTVDNKNYFVSFIDDYTHYTVTYLITFKWEVLAKFKEYVAKATTHFNKILLMLYSDNGDEYLMNEFKAFYSQQGITYVMGHRNERCKYYAVSSGWEETIGGVRSGGVARRRKVE